MFIFDVLSSLRFNSSIISSCSLCNLNKGTVVMFIFLCVHSLAYYWISTDSNCIALAGICVNLSTRVGLIILPSIILSCICAGCLIDNSKIFNSLILSCTPRISSLRMSYDLLSLVSNLVQVSFTENHCCDILQLIFLMFLFGLRSFTLLLPLLCRKFLCFFLLCLLRRVLTSLRFFIMVLFFLLLFLFPPSPCIFHFLRHGTKFTNLLLLLCCLLPPLWE